MAETSAAVRMLVTGSTGYLGSHLCATLATRTAGQPIILSVSGNAPPPTGQIREAMGERFDLTKKEAVLERVLQFDPDVIVHCAALSQTGACETNPELAAAVNVKGTENLATAFAECIARRETRASSSSPPTAARPAPVMVVLSTDWVYAGPPPSQAAGLHEDDPRATGFSVYGRSKVGAEEAVRRLLPTCHVILRTALIYGPPAPHAPDRLRSCLGWMIDSLYEGKKMQLFEDEFRTPVLVHDVVATIEACLQLATEAGEVGLSMANILSARGAGPCDSPTLATFNIGGATRASRLDLGHALARAMELEDAATANEVLAGTTLAAQNLDGKRPRDLTLDSSKATRVFALEWHTLDAGLTVVCGEAAPQLQLAAEGAE